MEKERYGTGLYYYRARYYSPEIGRLISEDPIGFAGGDVNFYRYVGNRPVNRVDPFGLKVLKCKRPTEIAWGLLPHYWIKTDTKEAGMGEVDGTVPRGQLPMSPYPDTAIIDHTGQSEMPEATCEEVPNVAEEKVNELLEIGKRLGRWSLQNNCWSLVNDILDQSRMP